MNKEFDIQLRREEYRKELESAEGSAKFWEDVAQYWFDVESEDFLTSLAATTYIEWLGHSGFIPFLVLYWLGVQKEDDPAKILHNLRGMFSTSIGLGLGSGTEPDWVALDAVVSPEDDIRTIVDVYWHGEPVDQMAGTLALRATIVAYQQYYG